MYIHIHIYIYSMCSNNCCWILLQTNIELEPDTLTGLPAQR